MIREMGPGARLVPEPAHLPLLPHRKPFERSPAMSTRRAMLAMLVLAAAVSCRPDDQRTDTLDPHAGMRSRDEMNPAVVVQLDSGSAAYRVDHFNAALEHYRRATELDPEVAAAWFGVYMALHALGNLEEAQAALERAQGIVPGATMLHDGDSLP